MITKLFRNGIEQKIVINLRKAEKDVKIAVAWFTNPTIFNVLLELVEKDVSIELILCDDKINFANPKIDFQQLIDSGGNIRISKYPQLMHNKFCIIDSRVLINGSYNWTMRAEKYNLENVVLSTDKELIAAFEDYFREIVNATDQVVSIPDSTFHSYYSQDEVELELKLEDLDKESLPDVEQEKSVIHTDEINQAIDEADLLYRNAEHEKCIEFCKGMVKKYPVIADFHLLLAVSYWRTNKNKELIASAKATLKIDDELYDAYNLLGIGYAKIPGGEQQSIKNYTICLGKYPDSHSYLRNRAITKTYLENDKNIPFNVRSKFRDEANEDFNRIIRVVSSTKPSDQSYNSLYSRSIAYQCLGKLSLAKKDVDLALEKYSKIEDKFQRDKNIYLEMKSSQRKLKTLEKSQK